MPPIFNEYYYYHCIHVRKVQLMYGRFLAIACSANLDNVIFLRLFPKNELEKYYRYANKIIRLNLLIRIARNFYYVFSFLLKIFFGQNFLCLVYYYVTPN
jgi:hypothetical protein